MFLSGLMRRLISLDEINFSIKNTGEYFLFNFGARYFGGCKCLASSLKNNRGWYF